MGSLSITEYEDLSEDGQGETIPAGKEPAINRTVVTTSGASAFSVVFSDRTNFVRIQGTAAVAVNFGVSNPTASATDTAVGANDREFFGVTPGMQLAAIEI